MTNNPVTWVLLGDKKGDNGQVDTIAEALPWPVEHKYVHMQPRWVEDKPAYRPSIDHLDPARSDALEAPWPDLIITIGRRPSMAALWIRQQSDNHTKIVLVGKPSGHMTDFSLVVFSAENQMPPLPGYLPITLPLMRVQEDEVEVEAERWRERLSALPKPLTALFVGGQTMPYIMNRRVGEELVATAKRIAGETGGTPYIVTSRRTPDEVLAVLRDHLPKEAQIFEWSAGAEDNPYRALLGTADGFVVTGDSISMMVEVVYLRKPLAIFSLPFSPLGRFDQLRRSLARRLFNPQEDSAGDRLRLRIARLIPKLDPLMLFSATRDFQAFHRLLVDKGLAVWAGQPFKQPEGELPDDVGEVIRRIEGLF